MLEKWAFVCVCVCVCVYKYIYIYISTYDSAFFQHMILVFWGFFSVINWYIFDISIDICREPCRHSTSKFADIWIDICAPPYLHLCQPANQAPELGSCHASLCALIVYVCVCVCVHICACVIVENNFVINKLDLKMICDKTDEGWPALEMLDFKRE